MEPAEEDKKMKVHTSVVWQRPCIGTRYVQHLRSAGRVHKVHPWDNGLLAS